MCQKESCCKKTENLKSRPEECTAEEIRRCHGDSKSHPCTGERCASRQ